MKPWELAGAIALLVAAVGAAVLAAFSVGEPDPQEAARQVWDDRAETDALVHDVIRSYLQAAGEEDWERVHDLTATSERPPNRTVWLDGRDDEFTDKCAGDPYGRVPIDVVTLEAGPDRYLLRATVWVQSNQGLTCIYEVVSDAGFWRVGENVPRAAPGTL